MEKSLQQLKETLQRELEMYQEILSMEKNKAEFIKSGDLERIEKTTLKEQQYIKNMGTFEKLRRAIFTNMAAELQVIEIESISDLLLYLKDEDMMEIDNLRNHLLSTIDRVKEVNELNETLINKHLEYVNFNIELMTSTPEGSHYGQKDTGRRKITSSLLDMKI